MDSEDGRETCEVFLQKGNKEYNYTMDTGTGQFLEMDFGTDN